MWRPGRDSDPGLAGDSRSYYSGIERAGSFYVTGLYYQGYLPRNKIKVFVANKLYQLWGMVGDNCLVMLN